MPPVLASAWFAPHEHFLCVTLAETANFIGDGVVYLLSSILVSSADDIPRALWIYALISTCGVIYYFIVGKNEPNMIILKIDVKGGMR